MIFRDFDLANLERLLFPVCMLCMYIREIVLSGFANFEIEILDYQPSDDLKDLITHMLAIDPDQRITMKDVASHPFFTRPEYQEDVEIPSEKKMKLKPKSDDIVVINAVKCDSMTAFKRDVPPFSWPRRFSK